MIQRRVRSSRLGRNSEKQNKKQATLFTIGIIVLIVVLLQFGPLLINVFGNVVYTIRGADKENESLLTGKEVVQPPTLTGIADATQSARISFSGTAQTDSGTVEIYVNDELEDEIDLEKNTFEVKGIPLSKGKNIVKARLVKGEKTSAFSEEFEISYIADKPKLEVSSPTDGASFAKADKNISITGTTDPDNTVSVNSFRAIVESNGEFSYLFQLSDGENQIKIVATNPAGSTSEKQIKITYSP